MDIYLINVVTILALLITAEASCFTNPVAPVKIANVSDVKLVMGGWASQIVPGYIAYILVRENMAISMKWHPNEDPAKYQDFDTTYHHGYNKWFDNDAPDIGFAFAGVRVTKDTLSPDIQGVKLIALTYGR